jgi:serine/threonine protein kinase
MNLGRFRIIKQLPGPGGRDVYLAAAEGEDYEVVLEVLGAPQRNQGMLDPRLADEAASYARLDHPNIVKVVELFSADGRFVIALEQFAGSTLELLGDATAGMSRQDVDACWIYVACCVFDALAAAHGSSDPGGKPVPVLHRNVNPSNVRIAWDGTVKLGNFSVGNVGTAMRPSHPSFTWNTAPYMAPEQLRLQKAGAESDVYAATLILWELLAGRKAVERRPLPGAKILELVMNARIPPLEEVRPGLDARVLEVVRAGLQAHPSKRTIGAAQARDALRSAIDVEAARRRFAEAVGRARATHDAPTVAPVPTVVELEASALESVRPPPASQSAAQIEPLPVLPHAGPAVQRRRAGRIAVVAALGVGCCILVAAALVRLGGRHDREERGSPASVTQVAPTPAPTTAATAAPTPTPTPTPTQTPSPSPTPTASATASAPAPEDIPGNMGQIQPPASAAGHRIFFDGRVVGEGATPIRVPCGMHSVRIGSAGRLQYVDVPCGQSIAVTR